jgi:hypothetical protein
MSRLVRLRIRRRKVRRAGLLHGWLSLPHGNSLPTGAPEFVDSAAAVLDPRPDAQDDPA